MGLFTDLGKIGIVISFFAALFYEITGAAIWKAISIITAAISIVVLSSYLSEVRYLSKARDVLQYLKLLK